MHNPRLRRAGVALAFAGLLLMGCARKVQIQVPNGFHGRVHILCTGLTDDRSNILRVDTNGELNAGTCPVRQTDAVVTRQGAAAPVETSVMWTTTGDGLVREITFDVR